MCIRDSPVDARLCERLFEARPDPVGTLSLDQFADLHPRHDDEIMPRRKPVGDAPEGLAQRPLDTVAVDRAADLAAHRDAEPDIPRLLVHAGKTVEDQVARRMGRTVAVDAIELAAAREPTCLLYTSPSPRDRTRSRMPSSA